MLRGYYSGKSVIIRGEAVKKPYGLRTRPRIQYTTHPSEQIPFPQWYERLKSFAWEKEPEIENIDNKTLKVWYL